MAVQIEVFVAQPEIKGHCYCPGEHNMQISQGSRPFVPPPSAEVINIV